MDYSKKGLKQKQLHINSKSEKLRRKFFINISKVFLVFAIAGVIIGASAALGAFKGCIDTAPDISSSDVAPDGFSTFVYDKDGNQMSKLVASNSNRISVTLDRVPLYLQKAFIAIEDGSFYEHNGIDIIGIIRAGVKGVLSGFNFRSGASTITQQLIKNTIYEDFINESKLEKIERKIQEWYLAIQISNELSKNEVLIRYLNTINLGQNTLGVQAAAHRYFGKDVSELTLSECAVIAAITKSPTGYNPIINPEANTKRRQNVLDEMLKLEYITKAEYDEALKDDPYTRIAEVNRTYVASDSVTSYFVDAVTDQVYNDLLKEGYTEQQAENLIYRSGLKINTTMDPHIQSIVDEICSNENNFPRVFWQLGYQLSIDKANGETRHYSTEMMQKYLKDTGYGANGYKSSSRMLFKSEEAAYDAIEYYKRYVMGEGDVILGERISISLQPQISVVILDQQTGYVKALLGGRGEKTVSKAFNRATASTRQPGSCFKVLAAYVPAIDSGMYTLASVQNDAPFAYTSSGDGNDRLVKNWHEEKQGYKGLLNYREGIRWSRNVITVKAMTLVTPQVGMDYLLNFGFTTLLSKTNDKGFTDVNQSLCLGGITRGVTNLEMTAAYAALANGGKYIEPTLYTTVLDKNGNIILDKSNNHPTRIIRDTTAWLITDAMEDVVTEGTGTSARVSGMKVAGKTGTTTDSMDVWFSGYTPYYTGSIWLGFDENNATLNTAEESTHTKIWSKIMTEVHKGLENKEIMEKPENIISVNVCSKSGKLPTPGLCDAHVYQEYFAQGTEPSESCNVHMYGLVCESDGVMATLYCPRKVEGAVEQLPVEHPLLQPGTKLGAVLHSLGENTEDVDIDALLSTVHIDTTGTCHHTFEYMLNRYWNGDPANGGYGYPDGWFDSH